jgi:hypothetical protein
MDALETKLVNSSITIEDYFADNRSTDTGQLTSVIAGYASWISWIVGVAVLAFGFIDIVRKLTT